MRESAGGDRRPTDQTGADTWLYGWALGYAAVGASSLLVPLYAIDLGAGAFVVSLIVAIAGAAIAPPTGLLVVGSLFVLVGVSWSVIAVTAAGIVSELAPEPVRSEALGMYTAVGSLGGGVGSILGGAIADAVGYLPAFAVAGGCIAVATYVAATGSDEPTTA